MSVTSSKTRQQMKRSEPSILTVGWGVARQGWMRVVGGAECDRLGLGRAVIQSLGGSVLSQWLYKMATVWQKWVVRLSK